MQITTVEYITEGMTVVDIGSNIGFYTELLSKLVRDNGLVYSFEPDRANVRHLENACRRRKNVITLQRHLTHDL
jgi:FkbM family methyltransferase